MAALESGFELPKPSVRCALVLGIGESGARIAYATHRRVGAISPCLLKAIAFLILDDEGLHPLTVSETDSPGSRVTLSVGSKARIVEVRSDVLVDVYLQLEQARNDHELTAAYRLLEGVDAYLVGSFEERMTCDWIPAAAQLFGRLPTLARRFALSLILLLPAGVYSAAQPDKEYSVQKEALQRLGSYIRGEETGVSVRPEQCYLIDWFSCGSIESAEEAIIRWLAVLLCSDLSSNELYENAGLSFLQDGTLATEGLGTTLCASLGYSAYVLPIDSLMRYSANRLGASLVREGLLGENKKADNRWLIEMLRRAGLLEREGHPDQNTLESLILERGFDPDRLASELHKGLDGCPIEIRLETDLLRDVPLETIADRIFSLDALLGRKVVRDYAPQMAAKKEAKERELREVVTGVVNRCISQPGTLSTLRALLGELAEKLGTWQEKSPRSPEVPDLLAHKSRLEMLLERRPRHGATLALFFLLGVFEAYVVPLLFEWLFGTPTVLQQALLLAVVIGLNLGWALSVIFLAEGRIHRAIKEFLEAIREKYEIVLEHWVQNHRSAIYQSLEGVLREEMERLERWEQILRETQQALQDRAEHEVYQPGPFEIPAIDDFGEYFDQFLQQHQVESSGLAREYITAVGMDDWREVTTETLANRVYRFCLQLCEKHYSDVSVEGAWQQRRLKPEDALERLRESGARVLVRYSRVHPNRETSLEVIGVPDRERTVLGPLVDQSRRSILVNTGDRGRVSYFNCLFGLALEDLDVVRLFWGT